MQNNQMRPKLTARRGEPHPFRPPLAYGNSRPFYPTGPAYPQRPFLQPRPPIRMEQMCPPPPYPGFLPTRPQRMPLRVPRPKQYPAHQVPYHDMNGCVYYDHDGLMMMDPPTGIQYGYPQRGKRRKATRLSSRFSTQAGKYHHHANFYVKLCAETAMANKQKEEPMAE